jgi:protein TonB
VKRLLPAALIAIAIHAVLLCVNISWNKITPEKVLDLKTIDVTLTREITVSQQPPVPQTKAIQPAPTKPEPIAAPIPKPPVKKVDKQPILKKPVLYKKKILTTDSTSVITPKPAPVLTETLQSISSVSNGPSNSKNAQAVSAAANSEQTLRVNDGISPSPNPPEELSNATPLYKKNPHPHYPQVARKRNLQGTVIILAIVNEKGEVVNARVDLSSGHAILDNAALSAVKSWEFEPGKHGNTPVKSIVRLPITFQLK